MNHHLRYDPKEKMQVLTIKAESISELEEYLGRVLKEIKKKK